MLRNSVLACALAFVFLGLAGSSHAADPALAQKWLTYGNQLLAAKQYDKAVDAFSTAARADSRNAAAWKGLGNAYYYKKDYANAAKYYRASYQLNPADTALGALIPKLDAAAASGAGASPTAAADRLYQAKRYDEAIQAYNNVVSQNPNDAKAWQGLGNCYNVKQDKPKAIEAYKRSLQLNPSNTALQNFMAKYAPESAASSQVADGPTDWVAPLWRSAILPGWGQYYNGEHGKAWLFGGVTVGLFGAVVVTYSLGSAAQTEYLAVPAGGNFDTPYATWESMANINHIAYIGFGLCYTYTLVDAVMSAKASRSGHALFQENPPDLQLTMLDSTGALGMKYKVMDF
ncbi:MAG: tetratricopeptide repeat protein [candidate division FCPU426 bacterium]